MTIIQQQKAAKKFVADWTGKGYEKGESQKFWLDLLCNVFGVQDFASFISFEDQVKLDHTSFIDGYISATKVLIEQKSIDKDLRAPIKQSDGTSLNPFQQAKRYSAELPYSQRPRWIVTSNFRSFLVYDMEQPNGEPEEILLENLAKEYYRLQFLVEEGNEHLKREMEVSVKAGELVGIIYDKLLEQYIDKDSEATLKSLNILCVRLVFCLYAEDAGLFNSKSAFHDYLAQYAAKDIRRSLIDLFQVLDTPEKDRDPYLDESLASFPYVNGGLFSDEHIIIPQFTDNLKQLILAHASDDFDWSEISPTIFGAIFESTLNPATRRSGGMHYTSIENIHKVIDPLFMDELNEEFDSICRINVAKTRNARLFAFQQKLGTLRFLDPACGSGNFLTETYLSLRRLENRIISKLNDDQGGLGIHELIYVKINQFHGIEINDFAVTVAKTALWIAESQMLEETKAILGLDIDFLPLKTNANIHEGNALHVDWASLGADASNVGNGTSCDAGSVAPYDYILGNPPFVGFTYQTKEQKDDLESLMKGFGKNIDYVAGWYYKAAQLMQGTKIKAALVSTNSITQGEQVAAIWKPMFEKFGIHFDFAYKTFRWDSEANIKAHVHCIIIGFSCSETQKPKMLFLNETQSVEAQNINGYLLDAPNIWIESRPKPLCDVPIMQNGGKPTEGGNLIMTEEEKEELVSRNPLAEKFLRPYMMGKDFIARKTRWCLWLVGANPSELKKCPEILRRVEQVRQFRLSSPKEATKRKAETPTLFDEVRECKIDYVAIPKVSSEQRRYIPMEHLSKEIIPGDKLFMIPDASLYTFGILTSNVHMAWMRAVCGRLKSDYSYSNTIVYNNFPWPLGGDVSNVAELADSDARKRHLLHIEQTAQAILDARALYPDSSLADLYNETLMPPELRKAHQANDRAVMAAYGFSTKMTESECVAELFKMYERLAK